MIGKWVFGAKSICLILKWANNLNKQFGNGREGGEMGLQDYLKTKFCIA